MHLRPFRQDAQAPTSDVAKGTATGPTVQGIVCAFLADQADCLAKSTHANYERVCKRFADRFGDMHPDTLRPSEVKQWMFGVQAWKKANTRWGVLNVLRRLFSWAINDRWIALNPMRGLVLEKGYPRRADTESEFQRMLAASDRVFRQFLLFVRFTGCRSEDARCLRWEWIDWEGQFAVIPRTSHKTGRRTRKAKVIPLPKKAIQLLKWLQARADGDGVVFLNREGRPWTASAVSGRLRTIKYKAGLPKDVTIHGLRHLWGTTAVAAGQPIKLVSECLGHAKVSTTEEFYVHIQADPALLAVAETGSTRRT